MQISRINSTNFYAAKNPQSLKKAAKQVAERTEQAVDYFYYANPVEVVKQAKPAIPAKAADGYIKESEQIVIKETPSINYGFVTDSMVF